MSGVGGQRRLCPVVYEWRAGSELVRCHHSRFGATEFNPSSKISHRFRPFVIRRRTVPTLYGARTAAGALSETLFHTVPPTGPDRRVRLSRLVPWQISHLKPLRDLRLADLRDKALGDLGLSRRELIESSARAYPETARIAKEIFESPLKPDGLIWNARQDKRELVFVLFARGRVSREDLEVSKEPVPMAVGDGYERTLEAAERLGITIVQ